MVFTVIRPTKLYCPELYDVIHCASAHGDCFMQIIQFVRSLVRFIQSIRSNDVPCAVHREIAHSYNPEKGVCYYFTESGNQLRNTPNYIIPSVSGNTNFDDDPKDKCRKLFTKVSASGYSHLFLWLYPIHGHSWGFHIINPLLSTRPNPPPPPAYRSTRPKPVRPTCHFQPLNKHMDIECYDEDMLSEDHSVYTPEGYINRTRTWFARLRHALQGETVDRPDV